MGIKGQVPEIDEVKSCLEVLRKKGIISKWELPYESLLTRLSAAIFFLALKKDDDINIVIKGLSRFPKFRYMENNAQKLSTLKYRIEFNEENG